MEELKISHDIVNVNVRRLRAGHPIGASGAASW
jgi:acetyl-CoA acetyltransferase